MKIIDLQTAPDGRQTGLLDRMPRVGKRAGQENLGDQERVAGLLAKSLSNHYVLLRNVILEDLEIPIPLVLVGPPGVRVLTATGLRGVYRVHEEIWEKLDDRQQKFRPAIPNLVNQAVLMGRAVGVYLKNRGLTLPEIEPILICSEPGLHVETDRPAVRVVMADATERFIAGLLQSRILLTQEEVEKVVTLLSRARPTEDLLAGMADEGAFPPDESEEPRKPGFSERVRTASEQAMLTRARKIPFTGRQWAILGAILLLNIVLVVVFLLMVLSSS